MSISFRNLIIVSILSVAAAACSTKKYDSWSDCFAQEIAKNGDYGVSLLYCNSNYNRTNDENTEISALGISFGDEKVNVRMPNGTIINNVPKYIDKKGLLRVLEYSGYDTNVLLNEKKSKITDNKDGSLEFNR